MLLLCWGLAQGSLHFSFSCDLVQLIRGAKVAQRRLGARQMSGHGSPEEIFRAFYMRACFICSPFISADLSSPHFRRLRCL